MRTCNLEYVRERLNLALADYGSRTKGQLDAFQGAALINTTRYKRRPEVEVGGQYRQSDPVACSETRGGKRPKPPIEEITFCLSSWRRAVFELEGHQRAWVYYCYAHNLEYDYQVQITTHVWEAFKKTLAGKRVTKKVTARLAQLVWLAVQQYVYTRRAMDGEQRKACELASLMGVASDNWSKHYADHWSNLIIECERLDEGVLIYLDSKRNDYILSKLYKGI
ncbi:bacteriophage antitermination protein Q [Hafnia alvei]|uniref:Phage antitermination protein Q n=1 Tax=Hafnia alvei TaxID=569 RepID=A0A1C6Z5B0_HAFAL|nr:bacteriophage antitermination protein Q [Hafnia alvei]NLS56383.1 antiterminator [Hafnia alvei]SCM54248.1 Phage antitermination protein Q [Hafnia alvei]